MKNFTFEDLAFAVFSKYIPAEEVQSYSIISIRMIPHLKRFLCEDPSR
jgi:hypothetical protein